MELKEKSIPLARSCQSKGMIPRSHYTHFFHIKVWFLLKECIFLWPSWKGRPLTLDTLFFTIHLMISSSVCWPDSNFYELGSIGIKKKRTVVTEKPFNWVLNKCHPLDNYHLQIVEHLIHEQKLLHVSYWINLFNLQCN